MAGGEHKSQPAFAVATVLGLGYLPKAPGTFGSLGGVLLVGFAMLAGRAVTGPNATWLGFALADLLLALLISCAGVWAATQVAVYLHSKDPQIVVVDEVAGQLISYLGLATPRTFAVNWKYLLAGFILFRVFDIWKPFPARQAESLPGGVGIMADDWAAGAYAAVTLMVARYLGL